MWLWRQWNYTILFRYLSPLQRSVANGYSKSYFHSPALERALGLLCSKSRLSVHPAKKLQRSIPQNSGLEDNPTNDQVSLPQSLSLPPDLAGEQEG